MGADIHMYGEKKNANGEYEMVGEFFDLRSYSIFAFLADVRNYSAIKPISPTRGIPTDVSYEVKYFYNSWFGDAHSASWLTLDELFNFDYQLECEDRRCTINGDGGRTAPKGEGKKTTYQEFLGNIYFKELSELKNCQADRVVFWFDN